MPDEVHKVLKVRAAEEGVSLSEYVLREIERMARRPTMEEVIARAQRAGSVRPSEDSATAVRAERDARG